jgi:hypothetical protein
MLWNENYYSCNKIPIYKGKNITIFGADPWRRSSIGKLTTRMKLSLEEEDQGHLDGCHLDDRHLDDRHHDQKSVLPLFYLKYALNYI